ncbi:ATPase [Parapusillimonas sp. SGNA-6]|nr:ATPase [Parapusillimonas sp. SGNA-6]
MTNEEALSRDIETLRERFTQTQELYREVCALLFFRYGITPTANKLYQLVRKGSMSAPADALSKFWADLREKSRTRIEHPELPDTLKEAAGELIASLWVKAQADAQESLEAYRMQANAIVLQMQATVAAAEAERDETRSESHKLRDELNQAGKQMNALREAVAASEATRASLQASLDEAKQDNATLQRKLEDARREFAAELDKLRAAMELAEGRSRSTEKRMLLEIDRERTIAAQLQKELDALTAVSHRTAEGQRREVTMLQQTLGDTRQKNGQLEGALQAVTASLERAGLDIEQLQTRLSESNGKAMVLRSQAEDWRRQYEESQVLLAKAQARKTTPRKPRGT